MTNTLEYEELFFIPSEVKTFYSDLKFWYAILLRTKAY